MSRRPLVFLDLERASAALARRLIGLANRSVRERGRFSFVISGGRTPLALYGRLAETGSRGFPWSATEVFFADERCVPPQHPDSNFGAAWEAFLSRVPIPRPRIHRLQGELKPPSEAAARYARVIGPLPRASDLGPPRFDVVLLGIGPDGHTASLFPGGTAVRDARRPVVAVRRSGLPPFVPRLTLTPRALSSARNVCFLVVGSDKAKAISGIFRAGPTGDLRYPASLVRPADPSIWFLDRAAAAQLPSRAGRPR